MPILHPPFLLLKLVNCRWFQKFQVEVLSIRTSFIWFSTNSFFNTASNIFTVSGIQHFVVIKEYAFLMGNSNLCNGRVCVDKDFLFATSSQKFLKAILRKSYNIVFWPWLSLAEKQHTFWALYNQNKTSNHIIIFNDSISKILPVLSIVSLKKCCKL